MIKDITSLEEFRKISGMTTRCYNVCVSAGIKTFGEFMDYVFTKNIRNIGNNTIQEIILFKSKYKDLRIPDSERDIDWEQLRIKAAVSALQGFASNPNSTSATDQEFAEWSVSCADYLIAELKKGGDK